MYIWILLATIMVALSFFNVSPRADKEHALNDIKAATVVNRFKAEHAAMLKTFNCEFLFRQPNPDWDPFISFDVGRTSNTKAVDISKYNPSALEAGDTLRELKRNEVYGGSKPYTKFTDHLPMGYKLDKSKKYKQDKIHHMIFCLKKDATEAKDASDFISCQSTDASIAKLAYHRYLVSYARISDRWISKDETKTPLPTLVNMLSKTPGSTAVIGWTDCTTPEEGCILRGNEAYTNASEMEYTDETYTDIKTGTEQKVQKPIPIILPPDALFWKDDEFKDTCNAQSPCLFAYEVFPFVDTACHCWNMLHPNDKKYGEACHTQRIEPYERH